MIFEDENFCLQPFVVPLSHAGLRARSLAIAGAPTLARATAEQGEQCRTVLQSFAATTFTKAFCAVRMPGQLTLELCLCCINTIHACAFCLQDMIFPVRSAESDLLIGLWQGNHDSLAAFMAATGKAALPEAAALSGLSLQKEFELCRGAFQCAVKCCFSAGQQSHFIVRCIHLGVFGTYLQPEKARSSMLLRPLIDFIAKGDAVQGPGS